MSGFPINDHRAFAPQPEVCELCGMAWPGADLRYTDADGIRGRLVCGNKQTGCAQYRAGVNSREVRDASRLIDSVGSGKHPIFPAGASDWWDDPI